jgi:hypothetical protein
MNTSRVLVALAAVSLMTYGSALAQQAPPAQPPQAPSLSAPAPAADAQGSASASAQTMTATGDLVSVDSKANTVTVKTTTGEMTFKFSDDTKISGATKAAAGLATMTGSQVTIRYKKDGSTNTASSIEVKPAASASPASPARPTPDLGRPTPDSGRPAPGGDDSKPPTPRP